MKKVTWGLLFLLAHFQALAHVPDYEEYNDEFEGEYRIPSGPPLPRYPPPAMHSTRPTLSEPELHHHTEITPRAEQREMPPLHKYPRMQQKKTPSDLNIE